MKKIFKAINLLLILPLIIFSKCEGIYMDKRYTIDLTNNASHSIGYYFATGGRFGTFYPDSLPVTNAYIIYDINRVIMPGFETHLDWDNVFRTLPKDTLSLFIFHTDTLNKYTWDEVRNGYKVLKRYNLSLADLERLNFKIVYP